MFTLLVVHRKVPQQTKVLQFSLSYMLMNGFFQTPNIWKQTWEFQKIEFVASGFICFLTKRNIFLTLFLCLSFRASYDPKPEQPTLVLSLPEPPFLSRQVIISAHRGSFSLESYPPQVEFLLFQVLNKDSKAHVWSLHAPFSSVLHTLHHLEKYKQHGSVLRLRTDSLHKHSYNKSWLIHCQNFLVSVEGGWGRMKAGTGKWKPSMSEQENKWKILPGFCWWIMTELIHFWLTGYYWKGKEFQEGKRGSGIHSSFMENIKQPIVISWTFPGHVYKIQTRRGY